eukprot:scaffold166205_cov26-Tisochrysis_lutea.AAC.2
MTVLPCTEGLISLDEQYPSNMVVSQQAASHHAGLARWMASRGMPCLVSGGGGPESRGAYFRHLESALHDNLQSWHSASSEASVASKARRQLKVSWDGAWSVRGVEGLRSGCALGGLQDFCLVHRGRLSNKKCPKLDGEMNRLEGSCPFPTPGSNIVQGAITQFKDGRRITG